MLKEQIDVQKLRQRRKIKMTSNINKLQLVFAVLFLTACSSFSSFTPKTIIFPSSKNVVKLKNGAVGVAPKGYCIGPTKTKASTGNIIYTACQMVQDRGMISISYAPLEIGETGEITRSYLASNQKVITTEYLIGYDLVKVKNNKLLVKSAQNTVWRTAKAEKGYIVLAQYFSPSEKDVSDLHQVESLTASIDNFSPPDNLLSREMFTPKIRPSESNFKILVSKVRPKLRP